MERGQRRDRGDSQSSGPRAASLCLGKSPDFTPSRPESGDLGIWERGGGRHPCFSVRKQCSGVGVGDALHTLHTKHGRNEEILKRRVSLNPSFQTIETKDPEEWEIPQGYYGRR